MFVSGGSARGKKIKAPSSKEIRPTSQLIKESFFEIFRDKIENCDFLDLFAGFGSMGIEAISRGASHVVFCDLNRHALSILHQNIDSLKFKNKCSIILTDAKNALLKKFKKQFDIIYIDPPYDYHNYDEILDTINLKDLLNDNGVAVTEHYHKTVINDSYGNLIRYRQEKYGQTILSFFEKRT